MEKLLSVGRKSTGLFALMLDTRPNDAEAARRESEVPLASVPAKLCKFRDRLLFHYDRLACVRTTNDLTAEALASLLIVLGNTVRDRRERTKRVITSQSQPAAEPRATAAHPRAFKGTKFKPPKSGLPEILELPVALCDVATTNELLHLLQPFLPVAIAAAEKEFPRFCNLKALVDSQMVPDAGAVWSAYNLGADNAAIEFPFLFERCFAASIAGIDSRSVFELLELYHQMDLQCNRELLLAACEMFRRGCFGEALHALRVVACLAPELRYTVLNLILKTELADSSNLLKIDAAHIQLIAASYNDAIAELIEFLFLSLAAGGDAEYVLEGYRLAREYGQEYPVREIQVAGRMCPPDVLDRLLKHLAAAQSRCSSGDALAIWSRAAELPGLEQVLNCQSWFALSPDHLRILLFAVLWGHEDDMKRWHYVKQNLEKIIQDVLAVPSEYRDSYIRSLCFYYEPEQMAKLHAGLRQFCLVRGLDALREDHWRLIAEICIYTSGQQFERFLHLPERAFKHIGSFFGYQNDRVLLNCAFEVILRNHADFFLTCLESYPAKCLRVMRYLGNLPVATVEKVVGELAGDIVYTTCFEELTDDDLLHFCRFVMDAERTGAEIAPDAHPIPLKLRQHLRGEKKLSVRQLQAQHEQMRQRLPLVRLQRLEQLVSRALPAGRPVQSTNEQIAHALQLANTIDDNKRAFNKFIRAYLNGQYDYIETHPLSKSWRQRYPQVLLEDLKQVPPLVASVASRGVIKIEIEHDPLEALKMGNAVSTCLGTGGICSYAAVANVLDVNKIVLFARDKTGAIFGRQLLGISTDSQLVLFRPYPLRMKKDVRQQFYLFDHQIAAALGIQVCGPADDYVIDLIIASDWWDDSAFGQWWLDDDELVEPG